MKQSKGISQMTQMMKVESGLSPCQAALLFRFDRAGCTLPQVAISVDIYLQFTHEYFVESLKPTCMPTRSKLSIGLHVKLLGKANYQVFAFA
jgi:hypothetical protein